MQVHGTDELSPLDVVCLDEFAGDQFIWDPIGCVAKRVETYARLLLKEFDAGVCPYNAGHLLVELKRGELCVTEHT